MYISTGNFCILFDSQVAVKELGSFITLRKLESIGSNYTDFHRMNTIGW